MYVFFFKQKTVYEMRISDGSSDVCSSDLFDGMALQREAILERGIDVAAGAAEADHRVLLVRLVLRAPDQVGVLVGLEVRQAHDHRLRQIGRASCRERVCQYV